MSVGVSLVGAPTDWAWNALGGILVYNLGALALAPDHAHAHFAGGNLEEIPLGSLVGQFNVDAGGAGPEAGTMRPSIFHLGSRWKVCLMIRMRRCLGQFWNVCGRQRSPSLTLCHGIINDDNLSNIGLDRLRYTTGVRHS
jgi:hypothetical protein